MSKANQNQKNIRPRQVTLYRNVFCSRVSTAVVLCLCTSFLLQPIERIYANEGLVTDTNEVVNLAVDANLISDSKDNVANSETKILPENLPLTGTEETSAVANVVATMPVSDIAEVAVNEVQSLPATTTEMEVVITNDNNNPATTSVFTEEEIQDLITDVDKLPEFEIVGTTITATTSENSIAVSNVYSDEVMQFNRTDCVTVEDGSFYCQNKKDEEEQGTDGMYALQDKDGDLEIFLQKNGELVQLTFNTVDDAAPVFDAKSNTIVWHRLVDERYQIISYDLEKKEEVQLTADNVNNMQPSRSGNNTVWQRWNDTNWDIVLYNGTETKFLTDSLLHDIAPNIKGDLIMWNRLATDKTQTIELYDIASLEFTTINDNEGGALSNPRMVLVYETSFANGDVVTKGYDVDTGEITPLANNPSELPEELPEPDPTGETSALIQPKNPTKEDIEIIDDIYSGSGSDPFGTATATSSLVSQPGDLLITSSNPAIAGSTPYSSTTTLLSAELTLDLTPPSVLTLDTPTDLVVTPFVSVGVDNQATTLE